MKGDAIVVVVGTFLVGMFLWHAYRAWRELK